MEKPVVFNNEYSQIKGEYVPWTNPEPGHKIFFYRADLEKQLSLEPKLKCSVPGCISDDLVLVRQEVDHMYQTWYYGYCEDHAPKKVMERIEKHG